MNKDIKEFLLLLNENKTTNDEIAELKRILKNKKSLDKLNEDQIIDLYDNLDAQENPQLEGVIEQIEEYYDKKFKPHISKDSDLGKVIKHYIDKELEKGQIEHKTIQSGSEDTDAAEDKSYNLKYSLSIQKKIKKLISSYKKLYKQNISAIEIINKLQQRIQNWRDRHTDENKSSINKRKMKVDKNNNTKIKNRGGKENSKNQAQNEHASQKGRDFSINQTLSNITNANELFSSLGKIEKSEEKIKSLNDLYKSNPENYKKFISQAFKDNTLQTVDFINKNSNSIIQNLDTRPRNIMSNSMLRDGLKHEKNKNSLLDLFDESPDILANMFTSLFKSELSKRKLINEIFKESKGAKLLNDFITHQKEHSKNLNQQLLKAATTIIKEVLTQSAKDHHKANVIINNSKPGRGI
jgi:hypothetical protein